MIDCANPDDTRILSRLAHKKQTIKSFFEKRNSLFLPLLLQSWDFRLKHGKNNCHVLQSPLTQGRELKHGGDAVQMNLTVAPHAGA